jgi:hypothetical protein
MRVSRREGRFGIRAVAVLAVASSVLVMMGTVAEAKRINSVAGLRQSCAKGTGTFSVSADGQSAICDLKGGKTVVCDNKTKKCQGVKTIKARLVPEDTVELTPGETLTTQTVSSSQVFRRNVDFGLTGDVCAGLDGEFLVSVNGGLSACATSKAMIICADASSGKNCTGIAYKKANTACVAEQVDVARRVLFLTGGRTPSPPIDDGSSNGSPTTTSPPTTSSTTTSSTTTTTLSD